MRIVEPSLTARVNVPGANLRAQGSSQARKGDDAPVSIELGRIHGFDEVDLDGEPGALSSPGGSKSSKKGKGTSGRALANFRPVTVAATGEEQEHSPHHGGHGGQASEVGAMQQAKYGRVQSFYV
jgi:hypothetical protein